jgi:hypothetical protein
MRAHTITTMALVGARARTTRTIVALSLAVALLAATASSASADNLLVTCTIPSTTPPSNTFESDCHGSARAWHEFNFGDRQVGTTSPAQRFALMAFDETFNPRIRVSGDNAETNDCPPTLSPNAYCLITVTFTPTSTGPKGGTLSAGPGVPTVALTGTGVTTPTPPVLPLRVLLSHSSPHALYGKLWNQGKKLSFSAITNNDSTLVARGSKIKKTTKQVAAGEETKIRAKLKPKVRARLERQKRLKKNPNAQPSPRQARIMVKATDEFDQTATDVIRFPQW